MLPFHAENMLLLLARRYTGPAAERNLHQIFHPAVFSAIPPTVMAKVGIAARLLRINPLLFSSFTETTVMYSIFGLALFLGLVLLVICLLQK